MEVGVSASEGYLKGKEVGISKMEEKVCVSESEGIGRERKLALAKVK